MNIKSYLPVLAVIIVLNLGIYGFSDDKTCSIIHNGIERTYRIHVPPNLDKNTPMPLVFALHGGYGTGEGMKKLTCNGFDKLSDRDGFIVVYPDGLERHWNDSRSQVNYRAHKEKIDDVGFLSALMDKFIKEFNVDAKRIYATGISNGAMMSFRLASDIPERLAAIAPVAGAIPEDLYKQFSPSRPVSVLMISNTDDALVPWKGGDIGYWSSTVKIGKVVSVPDSVKCWATHNKCNPLPEVTELPDKDPKDGTRIIKEVYSNGEEGTEVILYTVKGGGHTWPGGDQYLSERIVGKTSRDMDANEVIWEFFKTHRRE